MDAVPLSSLWWRALAVAGLLAANAFFVAAEFALVGSRRARLTELADGGDRQAKLAQKAIQSLDRFMAGAQVGITLASIGLVWVAAPALSAVLHRLMDGAPFPLSLFATQTAAVIITFALLAAVHIIFGEFIPKSIALNHPVDTARWVAGPMIGFVTVARPFVSVVYAGARAILRMAGLRTPTESARVRRPEELISILRQSHASGHFDTQDVRLIEGVLEFTEKTARDVMTPRTEVIALSADLTVEDAVSRIAEAGRSRYPLIRESLDDILGVVHVKKVLAELTSSRYQKIETLKQEAWFVPGSREIEHLLTDMQRLKQQMAIVLDEYGGTAGIVTMEDLLEEIVGEIFDEYDEAEAAAEPPPDAPTLPGAMEIDEANERYQLGIADDGHNTVGGFVFGQLGRLPKVGDRVALTDGALEVVEMEARRVGALRILPSVDPGPRRREA